MSKPKYRIIENNGKFYPEMRKRFLFWGLWYPIWGKVNPNDPNDPEAFPRQTRDGIQKYTLFIEYARERIDLYNESRIIESERPIIHEYSPK